MNDRIICDNCFNYEVHPSGTTEICHAQKEGSCVVAWIDDDYRDMRFNGNIHRCKGYKKIPSFLKGEK
jgi:hypothetical protein